MTIEILDLDAFEPAPKWYGGAFRKLCLHDAAGALDVAPMFANGRAFGAEGPCALSNFRGAGGGRIDVAKLASSGEFPPLGDALARLTEQDAAALVEDLVDSLPQKAEGVDVMPADAKEAVKSSLRARCELLLAAA